MAGIDMGKRVEPSAGLDLEGVGIVNRPPDSGTGTALPTETNLQLTIPIARYGRSEGTGLGLGRLFRPEVGGSIPAAAPVVLTATPIEEGGKSVYFTTFSNDPDVPIVLVAIMVVLVASVVGVILIGRERGK